MATATHGSGNRNQTLAAAVTGMTLINGTGELVAIDRGHPDFPGAVVHLGALGVITELTLAIEPTFDVRQDVYQHLPWERLTDSFSDVLGAGYSVSAITDFAGDDLDLLWVKSRVGPSTGSGHDSTGSGHDSTGSGQHERNAGHAVRGEGGDGEGAHDPRQRPAVLHAAARRDRSLVGSAGPFPAGVHAEQWSGDPERVPDGPRSRTGRGRGAARSRRTHRAAGQERRDPDGGGGRPLAQPGVPVRHLRGALHLAAGCRSGHVRGGGDRAGAERRSAPGRTGPRCSATASTGRRCIRGWRTSGRSRSGTTRTASSAPDWCRERF